MERKIDENRTERESVPFRIYFEPNPYSKKGLQSVYQLIFAHTQPSISREIQITQDIKESDLIIVEDARTPLVGELSKVAKRMILLTVQERRKETLDQYLAGCRSVCKENWSKIKVVNINTNEKTKFVQKWWKLHLAIFSYL